MTELDGIDADLSLGLLEAARGVLSDMDLESVLARLLAAARDVCGARYAALGVLDPARTALERFVTCGIDEETRRRIGAYPRGRGVLGELIEHPAPLRLADVSAHPRSYGFPAAHPPMRSFLGVPVSSGGEPFGNLYLTDKVGADEFTPADERALVLLAGFAGVAIDHARQYSDLRVQRRELERTVAALDATVQIARAVGGETNLNVILELVAKRGRALVSARALVIELERGNEVTVVAGAGEIAGEVIGKTIDASNSLAGLALRQMQTLRLEDEPNLRRFRQHGLGRLGFAATAGLVVPLVFRGKTLGVLIAVDRLESGPAFSDEDQRLLESFAASAATAVATARSVEADRRSLRVSATEQERARWARELHDETLQNLAALRLELSAQLRSDDLAAIKTSLADSLRTLDTEIATLRSLIQELHPTALDDLGLHAALEDLAGRAAARDLRVDLDVEFESPFEERTATDGRRRASEQETAIYRIIQEALTNAVKHGHAASAAVTVRTLDGAIRATVHDDGSGFDPSIASSGFGLTSMRERAELVGGTLEISSTPDVGTTVTVTVPTRMLPAAISA
jgi:signal transduction histidine kinase